MYVQNNPVYDLMCITHRLDNCKNLDFNIVM